MKALLEIKLSGDVDVGRLVSHLRMVGTLDDDQLSALERDKETLDSERLHRIVLAMTDARGRLSASGPLQTYTLMLSLSYYMLNEKDANYQIVA